MKADGAITSEYEISEEEKEVEEELEEEAMQGDMLMVRRLLGSQTAPEKAQPINEGRGAERSAQASRGQAYVPHF